MDETNPFFAAIQSPTSEPPPPELPADNPFAAAVSPHAMINRSFRKETPWPQVADSLTEMGHDPEQFRQQYQLDTARKMQTGEGIGFGEAFTRSSIPFYSEGFKAAQASKYTDAVKRFKEGKGTEEDAGTIARFERVAELDAKRGEMFGGKLVDALGALPRFYGEAAGIGKGLGLGAKVVGIGQATTRLGGLGQFAGRQAVATPLMPSMYLGQATQQNIREGRDALDIKGFPTSIALGYANNLVLGSISKVAGGGVEGSALTRYAGAGALGSAEQNLVDVAAEWTDKLLPKEYRTGQESAWKKMFDGKTLQGGQESAVQFLTFAAFAAMHHEKPQAALRKVVAKAPDSPLKTAMLDVAESLPKSGSRLPVTAMETPAEPKPQVATLPPEPKLERPPNQSASQDVTANPFEGMTPDQVKELAAGVGLSPKQFVAKGGEKWVQQLVEAYKTPAGPENANKGPVEPRTAQPIESPLKPEIAPQAQRQEFGTGKDRNESARVAHEAVKGGGKAVYVDMDVDNMSGLIKHAGEEPGRQHVQKMLGIVHEELSKVGRAEVFGHSKAGDKIGDEHSAIVHGADKPAVDAALGRARERIAEYARQNGLHEVPYSKAPLNKARAGVGVTTFAEPFKAEENPKSTFAEAEAGTESRKGQPARPTPSEGQRRTPAQGVDLARLRELQAGLRSRPKVVDTSKAEGVPAYVPGEEHLQAHNLAESMDRARLTAEEKHVLLERLRPDTLRPLREIANDPQIGKSYQTAKNREASGLKKLADLAGRPADMTIAQLRKAAGLAEFAQEHAAELGYHELRSEEGGLGKREKKAPVERVADKILKATKDLEGADKVAAVDRILHENAALLTRGGKAGTPEELADARQAVEAARADLVSGGAGPAEAVRGEAGGLHRGAPAVPPAGAAGEGTPAAAREPAAAPAEAARPGGLGRPAAEGGTTGVSSAEWQARQRAIKDEQAKAAEVEEKRKTPARKPPSLQHVVRDFGGVDPKDSAFLGHWRDVGHARQNGVGTLPGFFKNGGRGFDQLAQELHTTGHLPDPSTQTLADMLQGKKPSLHYAEGDDAEYARRYDAYLAAEKELADARAEALKAGEQPRDLEANQAAGHEDASVAARGDGPNGIADPETLAERAAIQSEGRLSPHELAHRLTGAELEDQVADDFFDFPGRSSAQPFDPNNPTPGQKSFADVLKDKFGPMLDVAHRRVTQAVAGVRANLAELAGHMAPRIGRQSDRAGEAVARHVAAPVFAEKAVPHLVDLVMPKRWGTEKDNLAEGRKFMAALYEMRLRWAKSQFFRQADWARKQGELELDPKKKDEFEAMRAKASAAAYKVKSLVGRPNAEMDREEDYQRTIQDPEFHAFLDRWRTHVVPVTEGLFRKAQGLAETEAIDNLTQLPGLPFNAKAIRGDETGTDTTVRLGEPTGDKLRAPKARRLGFSRQFTGAAEGYDIDPRAVIKNSLDRAASLATKAEMYRVLVEENLGQWAKPGEKPDGEGWRKLEAVEPPRHTQAAKAGEKDLWVHPDAYKEVRRALDADQRWQSLPGFPTLTKGSLLSLVEAAAHTKNLMTFLFKPGVNPIEFVRNVRGVIAGDVGMRQRIVELAAMGAAKPSGFEAGTGGVTGMFTGGEGWKYDPTRLFSQWSSRALDVVDQAMRLTADRAFDSLTKRGAVNTETNRRNFINQLGQYQRRAQNDLVAWFRDTGLGPFATAGTNYTMQGLRALTFNPGVKTATAGQQAALRAEVFGRIAAVVAIAPLVNFLRTGRADGDDNTPVGAIYLGKGSDGKTIYFDLAALTGLTRGARAVGLLALWEGIRPAAHAKTGDIIRRALSDVTGAVTHPFEGPAVNVAKIALTGENTLGLPSGERVKSGDNVLLHNLQQALLNVNPVVSAVTGADRPGKNNATEEEVVSKLMGPFGPKFRKSPPGKPLPIR